jgi:hypothetical protein
MNLEFDTRSLRITHEDMPGYVTLHVTGSYNLHDMKILIYGVRNERRKAGATRLFVDLREMEGEVPNIDRFNLGQLIAELWSEPLKVAILNSGDRINSLFENTAVNRYATLKVGSGEKALRDWLLAP